MLFKAITTVVAVTVAVLAAPTSDSRRTSNGMAIPLTKHSSSLNTVNFNVPESHNVGSHTAKIIRGAKRFERNMGTLGPSALRRVSALSSQAGVHVDSMSGGPGINLDHWHQHQSWSATIFIGTPPQSFTVMLDTGSRQVFCVGTIDSRLIRPSDLFVPASNGDENCRSHPNLWDPASSRTVVALTEDFDINFEDGAFVMGRQYMDNVTFAGFTADSQTIGSATTYSQMAVSEFHEDGILGLAFPFLSGFHDESPLLHTLFSEGKLPEPVFSLKLTDSGGELYVGGTNEALYIARSLAFTPIIVMEYWEIMVDNIKVNDKIVLTDVPAIVDTGSYFFWGNPSQVLALHQAADGKAVEDGYYSFPCNSFPSMTFTISGKPYLVPANVLNQHQVEDGSSDCFSGTIAVEMAHDSFTLGSMFLQHFYTVFDFGSQPPRLGFATLAS